MMGTADRAIAVEVVPQCSKLENGWQHARSHGGCVTEAHGERGPILHKQRRMISMEIG